MSWFNIASTVIGTVVGGFAGYAFSVVSKPRFEYMGIVGNLLQNSRLQCGARFRITYRWIGEKFVARNSMGWIGIYDDGGKQVHGSPGVWTWGNAVSINIVGEETLILFLVHPSDIKSTNDPALIIPPTPLPELQSGKGTLPQHASTITVTTGNLYVTMWWVAYGQIIGLGSE